MQDEAEMSGQLRHVWFCHHADVIAGDHDGIAAGLSEISPREAAGAGFLSRLEDPEGEAGGLWTVGVAGAGVGLHDAEHVPDHGLRIGSGRAGAEGCRGFVEALFGGEGGGWSIGVLAGELV